MGLKGLGITIHETAAFVVVGVEKYHVVAIADEEAVVIWLLKHGLVNVVEHYVGNEQRQGATLGYASLPTFFFWKVEEFVHPFALVVVAVFFVVELTAYLVVDFTVLEGCLPDVGVEVVAVKIGIDDAHHLLLAFVAEMGLVEHALEALAHDGVGDDVVEFLDVAVGCIDVLTQVFVAVVFDQLGAFVEVGHSKLVVGVSVCLAI